MRIPTTSGLASLLLLIACGGGGGMTDPPTDTNRAPEFLEYSVLTDVRTLHAGEILLLEARIFDADGDELTLSWTADAGSFDVDDSTHVRYTAPAQTGQVNLGVELSDGELSVTRSSSFMVGTVVAGGDLDTGATWTLAKSPYVVLGELLLPADQTLIVEAGVEIQLRPGIDPTGGLDERAFFIEGHLDINGSGGGLGQRVELRGGRAVASNLRQHRGVVFRGPGSGAVENLRVTEGFVGIASESSGILTIDGGNVLGCSLGIQITGGASVTLRNTRVRDSLGSGVFVSDATAILEDCTLEDNATSALQATANSGAVSVSATGCNFSGSGEANVSVNNVGGFASFSMSGCNFDQADPLTDSPLEIGTCFGMNLSLAGNYWGFNAVSAAEIRARVEGLNASGDCSSAIPDSWSLGAGDWSNSTF